jgi:hypothetical protein
MMATRYDLADRILGIGKIIRREFADRILERTTHLRDWPY